MTKDHLLLFGPRPETNTLRKTSEVVPLEVT